MGEILFLAHCVPCATGRSDQKRAFHVLKRLAARNRVHLLAFATDRDDLRRKQALSEFTTSSAVIWRDPIRPGTALWALLSGTPLHLAAYKNTAMHLTVKDTLRKRRIDSIYVQSASMAQYVAPKWKQRLVVDLAQPESERLRSQAAIARWPRRAWTAHEARLLARYERELVERSDATLVASESALPPDRGASGGRFRLVEDGVDSEHFDPAASFARLEAAGLTILLAGDPIDRFDIDEARRFAETVLPHIRVRFPGARFAIVGAQLDPRLVALRAGQDGITVIGGVTDRRAWLAAASVVVAPQRAAGRHDSVLEAMAMARPVVASQAAAQGIDHAGTIRVGSSVSEIIDCVLWALSNTAEAEKMGRDARTRVTWRYHWQTCLAGLDMPLPKRSVPRGADQASSNKTVSSTEI